MVRRSIFAGLLIFAFGSASETLLAQTAPANPPKTAQPATTTTTKTATQTVHHKKPAHKKKVAEEPKVEAPPPPPPTPEDSPAVAPQVSYQNGQLSIQSENATLGSILSAVKSRTGAQLDGPGANSSDRVATVLGPGDPRDVLSKLLNSTKYDYILLGTAQNPNSVQKIILTARSTGSAPATTTAAAQPANNAQPAEQPDADQALPDAEIPDETPQAEEPPQPEPQAQPAPAEGEQQQNPQNPNQPKTPEQLLQELQRMQQQQQQNQQNREEPH